MLDGLFLHSAHLLLSSSCNTYATFRSTRIISRLSISHETCFPKHVSTSRYNTPIESARTDSMEASHPMPFTIARGSF